MAHIKSKSESGKSTKFKFPAKANRHLNHASPRLLLEGPAKSFHFRYKSRAASLKPGPVVATSPLDPPKRPFGELSARNWLDMTLGSCTLEIVWKLGLSEFCNLTRSKRSAKNYSMISVLYVVFVSTTKTTCSKSKILFRLQKQRCSLMWNV